MAKKSSLPTTEELQQTIDLLLEKGDVTAFQADAGMCGDYNSVIGMDKTAVAFTSLSNAGRRLSQRPG